MDGWMDGWKLPAKIQTFYTFVLPSDDYQGISLTVNL
jgi:hypothetical protein